MANGKEHVRAGKIAGAAVTAYRAQDQKLLHAAVELGGYCGGGIGARVPISSNRLA